MLQIRTKIRKLDHFGGSVKITRNNCYNRDFFTNFNSPILIKADSMNRSLSVALKYGLIIAVSLIAYFVILRMFGMHNNPWFRLANGIFMAIGIYFAIKTYKTRHFNEFTYVDGFKTGLLTGFIATGVFIAFMAVYMFHLDPEFTEGILKNWVENTDQGGGLLILVILVEGLASTAVLTLTCMQIFKKSQHVGQQEDLVDTNRNSKL